MLILLQYNLCVTHPPSRSAVSLCWFMFTTRNLCPGLNTQQGTLNIKDNPLYLLSYSPARFLSSPVTLAKCWTVEVFPVPVSPTRRTGSPLFTHTANCSSSTAEGRVAANVWLSLFMAKTKHVQFYFLQVDSVVIVSPSQT